MSSKQEPGRSRARRYRVLALGFLGWLACWSGSAARGGFSAPQAGAADEDPARRRAFVHDRHVPKVWASGASAERLRDCRGCHVFSADGTRDPQAVCLECHIAGEQNQNTFRPSFEPGWETLDGYRSEDGLFRHHTHGMLACRMCHQPEERYPVDPMPIRRGSAECTRCHGLEPTVDDIELVPPRPDADVNIPASARTQLLEQLNGNPNMGPERLGEFFHAEHLSLPGQGFTLDQLTGEGDRTGRCTSCHAPMLEAGTESSQLERFSSGSCGQCHIGRSGRLEFGTTTEPASSLTARTFSHADHLVFSRTADDPASASVNGYRQIEERGCHACHAYDSGVRNFIVSDIATHEGCRSCHTGEAWNAKKHGDWEGWGCTSCHTFDTAGGLASDRPTVEVFRRRAEKFVIESQVHPHIAGEGRTQLFEKSCSECHRAPVGELPSRVGVRSFSHSTHLPPDPEPEQCAMCHGSRVARAETSAQISERVDGRPIPRDGELALLLGLTYDLRACDECHRGGTPVPLQVDFEEIAPQRVTDFSHGTHIGRTGPDGAAIDCMTCHRPDDVTGGPVGTLPGAMACTQCHDHRDERRARISGDATAEELTRCDRCHVTAIPAAGGTLPFERSRLARLEGSEGQFHPSDQDCVECHQAEWVPFSEADRLAGDHVFASGGRHYDEFGVLERHQHQNAFLDEGGILCFMCHWAFPIRGINPEDEDTRDDFGNMLLRPEPGSGKERRFPGGQYREQFGGASLAEILGR